MSKNQLTVIHDSHGKNEEYLKLIEKYEYTIQNGDHGFSYDFRKHIDNNKHKVLFGNHDEYSQFDSCLGNIGHYGVYTLNGVEFYFVRGAFSIDKQYRTPNISWWEEEELSNDQLEMMYKDYKQVRPDIMITHTCPYHVAKEIGNPSIIRDFGFDPDTFSTRTQDMLQACFSFHQPILHVFSHFHRRWEADINGTKFICGPELGTTTIDSLGNILDTTN